MSYYELATLDTVIFGAGKASSGIEAWVNEGGGRLCGAWGTDIGTLNRVFVLRGFDTLDEMMTERERALRSENPFGCVEHLVSLNMESYRALDFLPPVGPGSDGPVYEFRTYRTRINGIMPTMAKWADAVPGREAYSKLTVAMYGLDGEPRLTQIWPYASLAARSQARAQSVSDGKWPPKGGPDWLTPDMTSQIALPLPFSPLK
ncbi:MULTISPECIES: NIPSNAP family protein [Alphaproteobacteria]|uniref:NIPSNAP family protein n=2 Tax=Alphaproteobacteria TaxID=28211 RepID=A0A512HH97_9HYPH|nr:MULTISPECIES: NIPSNAP family protein [Alphaproteobacteria]GEO84821.1 NIPSNAP family protein [Ciceribacter naphthalenivorans]GLR20558.1 NIPSNAP family protein [Ciceribacter naphthalenivorans]GLT03414.1 NIPSNAP family protein [Sphingomonas psychrolutea]